MQSKQMAHAIHLMVTLNGFELISSDLQLKRGNLFFRDTNQKGVEYGIYSSGYVRKRNTSDSPKDGRRSMYYTDNRWWQLNKVETISKVTTSGYKYTTTQRILTPGDYIEMAKTCIRVAFKSRMAIAKNKLK